MKMKAQFWNKRTWPYMAMVLQDLTDVERVTFIKSGPTSNLYEIEVANKDKLKEVFQLLSREK